ncbi:hypothetical protein VC273_00920 [Xanthomonas nasturtii]|uniref:ORC-CDC6 family AAA ATPase n=1 Tax=Xanthomonas TaxID=338 RepID=UPI002B230977|nr:hypothetical protein [Xanthomonas nasturtii]MEA9554535.1 hypothetical protein [Xanthomonas nasturtii]
MQPIPEAFSKNRSEEHADDNWASFIVPPFYNSLTIKQQTKAFVIVGGRGCGKTTLLKYLCYPSQFSVRRPLLGENDLQHIGLYWRADTNFLNSFAGAGLDDATWRSAFEHLLSCELGAEIIRAILLLNTSALRNSIFGRIDNVDLSALLDFDPELGVKPQELLKSLVQRQRRLAMWINNLDSVQRPLMLPGTVFLLELVKTLRDQLPYLSSSTFAVFVDEYENMRVEQQKLINGLLKHGKAPLLFNIAMKRNAWMTRETLGNESIEAISDYNEIDIEKKLEKGFDKFAAELLLFRLAEHRQDLAALLPISPEVLREPDKLVLRYGPEADDYGRSVILAAERMLPRVNESEAAVRIMSTPQLRAILRERVVEALNTRGSSLDVDSFLDDLHPEASVIMPALLLRDREDPHKILEELLHLRKGGNGRFSSGSDLIGNNLFGCVNQIYIGRRNSILFSGFDAVVLIAKHNIRHLLELVHRIFLKYHEEYPVEESTLPVVDAEIQAAAMREASETVLKKINGRGTYGPQLYTLVETLGSVFRARHRQKRQSEPEINHFTVARGNLTDSLRIYLTEAEKWSALYLVPQTKMKDEGVYGVDYVLNPIFSPHFQISFRKKRSITISFEQLQIMFEGTQEARAQLVKELGARGTQQMGDLFEGA